MINIKRSHPAPASLQSPEIRAYLDALAAYESNPVSDRPKPPASYRNSDVLEAFDRCFLRKCYLTERLFANSWSMDIEHFVPKNERPELRYEWSNLYPADPDANSMKAKKTPHGGYLDPSADSDDVENDIKYALIEDGRVPRFEAKDIGLIKAKNTAELLYHLHNGSDDNTERKTENLRHEIKKKYDKVANTLIKWLGAIKAHNSIEEFEAREELRLLLSRKAAFTMLLRSTLVVRRYVPTEILD